MEDRRAGAATRRLEDQIEQERRLQRQLRALLERLDIDDFLTTIEELTMRERYYTPDQLEQLEQRRQALGDDAIRDVEREWAEIFATLRSAMESGTDPADPELRPLAARGRELVAMFTGGDPGVTGSLKQMWENEDPEKVSHGMVDAEVFAYYGRVQAAADSG